MKKIDKNYDFESPAPTAKTLHSRYEMRLSSNEQPAPSMHCVLIGQAGESVGRDRGSLLSFTRIYGR